MALLCHSNLRFVRCFYHQSIALNDNELKDYKPFVTHSGNERFFICKDEGIVNSTGFVRGMMSKSMETEMYLTHVVKTIRRQLEKWDARYEVKLQQHLLDEPSYEVTV